jgi:hypothetical protein
MSQYMYSPIYSCGDRWGLMQSKTQNENPGGATKKKRMFISLTNCLTNLTPEHCLPELKYG